MSIDKVALAMIVRGTGDEPANLRRALESVAQWVDGIYITLTGPKEQLKEAEKVCADFKARVSYGQFLWEANQKTIDWLKNFFGYEPQMKLGDKIFLFDEARNFNFSQVPKEYEWIVWMDCDDVFRRGENLRKLTELGKKAQIDAFYMNYIYQAEVDENLNVKQVIIEHLRERLVRNAGIFKWIAPIHETLIEQRPSNKTDNNDCEVLHLATMEDRMKSLTRNLNNLELVIYKTEGKDPRHIYYLAKAYFDKRLPEYNEKAIPLVMQYLYSEHKSGWPEERSQACEYLADIYRQKGEFNNAVKAGMNALIEWPENPSIFINLSLSYLAKQDWDRALFWVRVASSIPEKKTTLVRNPRDLQGMTYEVIYNACLNKGMIDEAWAAAVKLQELAPDLPDVKNIYNFISQLREQRDVTKIVVRLADYLKKTGEYHKVKPLLAATPQIAENTPFIIDLNQKNNPPKYWNDDEIAIYCGPGFTNWSPKRLSDPREAFVGGSEEAVIYMSQELAKLGWKITVYADPGQDEGEYDGVKWLPYYKFNRLDHFNIIIAWRQIGFTDLNVKTKKLYIWNHDIQNPLEWTKERTDKITKALFLSKWHRDNVPDLPGEKAMVTSNGITL